MKNARSIDNTMDEILKQFELYNHINPAEIIDGENPKYLYKDPDFEFLEKSRETLKGLKIDKRYLLGKLFEDLKFKILYPLDLMEYAGRDAKRFTEVSIKLFGKPSEELVEKAYEILEDLEPEEYKPKTIRPETVKKELENLLEEKNFHGWTVKIEGRVSGAGVERCHNTWYVRISDEWISEDQLKRYKVHEIGHHVRRVENAMKQPYRLFIRLPGHKSTEEGLAIIVEREAGILSNNVLREYAARVIAVHLSLEKPYSEVLAELLKYLPKDVARKTVNRAKRGLHDTSQKGAFTKDHLYLKGMFEVEDYLNKGGDKEFLYTARMGVQHVPLVKKLLKKGVLKEG